MDAVLYEDGLDLCLKFSSPTQNPDTVAIRVERCAFPRINSHHHSVVLDEEHGTWKDPVNNKGDLHFH